MTQAETRQLTRVEDKIDDIGKQLGTLAVENQARKSDIEAVQNTVKEFASERKSVRAGLWAICLLILSQCFDWLRAYLPALSAGAHAR
jgi:hypothetical protein